jgi:Protein of unknown function (DUF1566)
MSKCRSQGKRLTAIILFAFALIVVVSWLTPAAQANVPACTGQPDGTSCDDGNACTYGDICAAGTCSGTPILCDSDPCTTRTCNGTSTCTLGPPAPDGTACDDGNVCDGTDTCTAGGCAGTMIVDDGVQLTRPAPGDPTAVISWNPASGATGSDVVRGLVSALPASPIDAGETLLVRSTDSTNYQDATVPLPGACFWYLVRGRTSCGGGPWGFETRNVAATTQRQPREGCVVNVNASPQYFDNGRSLGDPEPTVTDIHTCVVWEKKSQPGETAIHSVLGIYGLGIANGSWISSVNAEDFAGHSDWKVSSFRELDQIVDLRYLPSIDPIFGPTAAGAYWTSTFDDYDPSYAWFVDFYDGYTRIDDDGDRYVRAVRGGP